MMPEELMRLAIAKAQVGIAQGQSPFGCAIVLDGNVLSVEHNVVWATTDVTAHAEITALRSACTKAVSVLLEGAVVATTCEPCPMCMAALLWARVDTIYFGATIADAAAAGFHEIALPASEMAARATRPVNLHAGILAAECVDLFRQWREVGGRAY